MPKNPQLRLNRRQITVILLRLCNVVNWCNVQMLLSVAASAEIDNVQNVISSSLPAELFHRSHPSLIAAACVSSVDWLPATGVRFGFYKQNQTVQIFQFH